MLTFLSKVRKSLIDSGSTQKYVIYAIGEIFLIVIGILIALSINNWNENQKAEKREAILVKNINQEIQKAYSELEVDLQGNKEAIKSLENYLNLSSTVTTFELFDLFVLATHNPATLEIPLITSILDGNEAHSISNIELLERLREVNIINEDIKIYDSYLDELWNNQVSEFLIRNNYTPELVRLFFYDQFHKQKNNAQREELEKSIEFKNLMATKLVLQLQWVIYQEDALELIKEIQTFTDD